jgi:hypothetical protein
MRTLMLASRSGAPVTASWRTTVLLAPGRYRLLGTLRADKVVGAADDMDAGASLRVSGQAATRRITGTTRWEKVEFEFEVLHEPDDVELVVELRAAGGKVWVQQDSLRITRLRQ